MLHEIVIRQEHSVRRDGLPAAVLVVQFLISPEILVMCLLLAASGRGGGGRWAGARSAAGGSCAAGPGVGAGVTVVLLAYPAWYGLHGPQSVSGVLFLLAPFAGVPLSGLLSPGAYAARPTFIRYGGYLGHTGPPPDYVGRRGRRGRRGAAISPAAGR